MGIQALLLLKGLMEMDKTGSSICFFQTRCLVFKFHKDKTEPEDRDNKKVLSASSHLSDKMAFFLPSKNCKSFQLFHTFNKYVCLLCALHFPNNNVTLFITRGQNTGITTFFNALLAWQEAPNKYKFLSFTIPLHSSGWCLVSVQWLYPLHTFTIRDHDIILTTKCYHRVACKMRSFSKFFQLFRIFRVQLCCRNDTIKCIKWLCARSNNRTNHWWQGVTWRGHLRQFWYGVAIKYGWSWYDTWRDGGHLKHEFVCCALLLLVDLFLQRNFLLRFCSNNNGLLFL